MASALIIDYILTVAVSIVAGSLAITSAISVAGLNDQLVTLTSSLPGFLNPTVLLTLIFIGLMVLANLGGCKNRAPYSPFPAYLFVIATLILITVGMFKYASDLRQHPLLQL